MWDKIASEWSGEEDQSIKRKRCRTAEDKRDFVTLFDVKCETLGDTQAKGWRKRKYKHSKARAEDIGTTRRVDSTRTEGTTARKCGDSNVAERWTSGHNAMGQKIQKKIGRVQKALHSWWQRKIVCPVEQTEDYVKHIFQEHNQESDHLPNLGAEVQRKITVE